jgi:hypothetical protein
VTAPTTEKLCGECGRPFTGHERKNVYFEEELSPVERQFVDAYNRRCDRCAHPVYYCQACGEELHAPSCGSPAHVCDCHLCRAKQG